MRPGHLIGDTTPTLPVLQHVVDCLALRERFDAVFILQPTSHASRERHRRCDRPTGTNRRELVISFTPWVMRTRRG